MRTERDSLRAERDLLRSEWVALRTERDALLAQHDIYNPKCYSLVTLGGAGPLVAGETWQGRLTFKLPPGTPLPARLPCPLVLRGSEPVSDEIPITVVPEGPGVFRLEATLAQGGLYHLSVAPGSFPLAINVVAPADLSPSTLDGPTTIALATPWVGTLQLRQAGFGPVALTRCPLEVVLTGPAAEQVRPVLRALPQPGLFRVEARFPQPGEYQMTVQSAPGQHVEGSPRAVRVEKTFMFTTAGHTGRTGPTQAEVDRAYAGTALAGTVTCPAGIQEWVVPASGRYRIEAAGAQGGSGNSCIPAPHNAPPHENRGPPGRGARILGTFGLGAGDRLKILVGQRGTNGTFCEHQGGTGGGGSFVVRADGVPLLVAAGGNGAGCTCHERGYGGLGSTTSRGDVGGSAVGPVDGTGGGGFSRDGGMTSATWQTGRPGKAFTAGGLGGDKIDGNGLGWGGFGGGGAAHNVGGGGGGWSGGCVDGTYPTSGGQQKGACSYNVGADKDEHEDEHWSDGFVRITWLGP